MLQNIGIPGLIIILIITLIIFGPKKLPEVGSAFGKTLSEFKKSAQDIISSEDIDSTNKGIEVARSDKVTDLIKK
ncbi:twin-arginine translocase TatA/TatE family subunit [Peribacillus huizhouensis]|uniref:Sec-independent protein translocase protein TatA n=1 Tax=Peribacillus huizhouensis TaxID=1501239 RepID=A0ABR6CTR0_9BACI|nr:twin-arginine translocase TatA/TatE family subunit [Peribacillus huizhouensis]MBA9028429.1 sec-independent protein translocase protein TatA [Peribacillus huizhouensis]